MGIKSLLCCIFAGSLAASAFAKEKLPVNLGLTADVFSKYVCRGSEYSEGPVMWLTPTANYKEFTLIGFTNFDFHEKNINEANIFLDYTKTIKELSLSGGYSLFFFPNTDYPKTQEVYAGASLDKLLQPGVKICWDFDDGKGVYAEASIGHSVTKKKLTASAKTKLGYNHKYYREGTSFSHIEPSLSLTIEPKKDVLSITPSANYSKSLNKDFKDIFYAGLNVDMKF